MTYAQTGFSLEVDLSRGNIEKVAVDPKTTEEHLGGQGVAARIIWDRVPPEVEPASPNNLLVFSAGLLAGTPVPGANRTSISSISPQTNLYVNSGIAGFFGPELKYAGYDSIIIRGSSPDLVYLWINNDKVEIRDAEHLRGKSALETAALIQKEVGGSKVQVAAIGLAGENLVTQATIDHANTSATRGVGVVMGGKRLKAIAVRGSRDVTVAHPGELFTECSRLYRELYDNPHCGDVYLHEDDDAWHVRNHAWNDEGRVKGFWTEDRVDEWSVQVESEHVTYQWENYSQEMEEHHETVVDKSEWLRGTGCYNCTRDCHQAVALPDQRSYFLKSYVRLSYAMAAYEHLKFNYDILYDLQNYGLDESALPPVLAFAVALSDAGILTESDLPEFPNDDIGRLSYLIEKIARRDGIGDLLADGVHQAAQRIGRGAEAYDHSAKKVEHAPLMQQASRFAYFLMYATGERMHITQVEGSFPQQPMSGKAERERFVQEWDAASEQFKKWFMEWEPGQDLPIEAAVAIADWNETMHYIDDALGVCPLLSSFRGQFGGRPPYHAGNLPGLTALATGMLLDRESLYGAAARNRQLVRAINARRGQRRVDESVSGVHWSLGDPELERQLLDAYYTFKGWTGDGIPTRETLTTSGLNYACDDFVKRGLYEVAS